MSNQPNTPARPKLRFPEFLGSPEWETELFESLYSFQGTNTLSRDKLTYEGGAIKNIHYGDIHTKFSTLFDITKEKVPFLHPSIATDKIKKENYCVEGDVIFADASEDLNDIGKSIEIVNLNGEKVLSGLHTQFARQKSPKLFIGFAGYLFISGAIRAQIQNEAQGTKVLGISAGRLSKIKICYPSDKQEQQRIAATLSSLDELLAAQTARLAALQAHKRGLMQALFPADGETVPKLRFPEFLGSPEWEEKKLGEVCKINPRVSELPEKFVYIDLESVVDGVLLRKNMISKQGSPSRAQRLLQAEDVIFQMVRPYQKNNYFFRVQDNDAYVASTGYAQLRAKESPAYLFHLIHTDAFVEKVLLKCTGSSYPAINSGDLSEIQTLIPSLPEQQKIADCLSSLDSLITAQRHQLDALKLHKKGLMQGLFPAAAPAA